MPLVLVDSMGAAVLPAMAGICWCLFGIVQHGQRACACGNLLDTATNRAPEARLLRAALWARER